MGGWLAGWLAGWMQARNKFLPVDGNRVLVSEEDALFAKFDAIQVQCGAVQFT